MIETQAPPELAGRMEEKKRTPVGAFVTGVLSTQIVNNALHLAQPLLIIQLSGSLAAAAFFSSFETAVHTAGSLIGGWPTDRFGPKRVLVVSTALRGASVALVPLAWAMGRLTLAWAIFAYTLDALSRGFVDTSVHALPLTLTGGERAELDRLNSRYELAFDLGAVVGPALLGVAMVRKDGLLPHALIPVGFFAAAVAYAAVPKETRRFQSEDAPASGGTIAGLRLVFSDPRLRWTFAGLALLNFYPLRKLIPAFFAKAMLHQPASAAWLGAVYGLGGVLGSVVFSKYGRRLSNSTWVGVGALGIAALAVGWLPGTLGGMAAASLLFAFTNVGARLALTAVMQQATPEESIGGVTGVTRFASNLVSVALKALVGVAFAAGASPAAAFAWLGAGLGAVALTQLGLSRRLARD